jgi:hypothetical protein
VESEDEKMPVACLGDDDGLINLGFGGDADMLGGEVLMSEVVDKDGRSVIERRLVCADGAFQMTRDSKAARESLLSVISLSQSDLPVEITTWVYSVIV